MSRTATQARHPEGWRPELKEKPLVFRVRNDTLDGIDDAVAGGGVANRTEFSKEAIEARLGWIVCDRGRCGERVPLRFGNLGGTSLDPWIALAVRVVRGQDCHHHEPVTVGIDQ